MQIDRNWILQADLQHIRESLFDLQVFGSLHPLIVEVQKLEGPDEFNVYQVVEKPFSWLPIRIRYRAAIYSDGPSYRISGLPLLKATLTYNLEKSGIAVTTVGLHLKISGGVYLLRRVLASKMLSAQDAVMRGIEVSAPKKVRNPK